MAQNDHLFHVKPPFKAAIQFVELFNGKSAPVFIESLSDQFIVFHSHLGFPIQRKDKQVPYKFTIEFLNETFVINGVLLRDLTATNATIYTFEGKFDITDEERSRLFKLLNRYNIMVHKLQREEALQDKKTKKSISRYV